MKKIGLIFLLLGCLLFVGCASSKEEPAEVTIMGENKQEITYQFTKAEDPEKVREIFENLMKAKMKLEFDGASIDIESAILGNVLITNQETRTIDLNYSIGLKGKTNFKKYLLAGELTIDGFVKTDSDSLSLQNQAKGTLEVANDDDFLYAQGNVNDGNTRITVKHKVDIKEFTKKYKSRIISFIDVVKHYTVGEILDHNLDFIEKYQVVIVKTTKDSFTLQFQLPANLGMSEVHTNHQIPIEVELYCSNLLPKRIHISEDKAISLWLENKYVEEYLSSKVEVKNAKLDIKIQIEYDYITIQELTLEEKQGYKEYKR